MHHAILFASVLGLVAFAFGNAAAVTLARCIIYAVLTGLLLLVFDVLTYGALSGLLVK